MSITLGDNKNSIEDDAVIMLHTLLSRDSDGTITGRKEVNHG